VLFPFRRPFDRLAFDFLVFDFEALINTVSSLLSPRVVFLSIKVCWPRFPTCKKMFNNLIFLHFLEDPPAAPSLLRQMTFSREEFSFLASSRNPYYLFSLLPDSFYFPASKTLRTSGFFFISGFFRLVSAVPCGQRVPLLSLFPLRIWKFFLFSFFCVPWIQEFCFSSPGFYFSFFLVYSPERGHRPDCREFCLHLFLFAPIQYKTANVIFFFVLFFIDAP